MPSELPAKGPIADGTIACWKLPPSVNWTPSKEYETVQPSPRRRTRRKVGAAPEARVWLARVVALPPSIFAT